MIGKAYVSIFQFYNKKKAKMEFKQRPVLVIGQADEGDYIVLPVSSVSNPSNIDPYYDVKVRATDYPLMNLNKTSYIRTHKQTVIHRGELVKEIVDFKGEYEDTYVDIISKVDEFQRKLIDRAI